MKRIFVVQDSTRGVWDRGYSSYERAIEAVQEHRNALETPVEQESQSLESWMQNDNVCVSIEQVFLIDD